jgi:osmotically-inducible protein OsmY
MDEARRKWTQFLYGVDWRDASVYDIVLNLEQLSLDEARDIICQASHAKRFRLTPETKKAMNDLALASRVKAKLAMDSATSNLQVQVTADGGSISIKADILSPAQAKTIGAIVHTVPGVTEIHLGELALATRF